MDVKFNAVICYREQFEKGRSYYPVSAKRFVREEDMREEWVVSREAACHPRGVGYYAPAAARAVVHAVERPGSVVAGFSALALYGLPFLVEGADTTLLARVAKRRRPPRPHPHSGAFGAVMRHQFQPPTGVSQSRCRLLPQPLWMRCARSNAGSIGGRLHLFPA